MRGRACGTDEHRDTAATSTAPTAPVPATVGVAGAREESHVRVMTPVLAPVRVLTLTVVRAPITADLVDNYEDARTRRHDVELLLLVVPDPWTLALAPSTT